MKQSDLQAMGFVRFLPVGELRGDYSAVPEEPGVYAVVRPEAGVRRFLEHSSGAWHKDRCPTVDRAILARKWVHGTELLYFGKAGPGGVGRRTLRQRVREYLRFGSGQVKNHWGGRYIWQLADSEKLLVGWMPACDSRAIEKRMLRDFKYEHGRLPFANLRE